MRHILLLISSLQADRKSIYCQPPKRKWNTNSLKFSLSLPKYSSQADHTNVDKHIKFHTFTRTLIHRWHTEKLFHISFTIIAANRSYLGWYFSLFFVFIYKVSISISENEKQNKSIIVGMCLHCVQCDATHTSYNIIISLLSRLMSGSHWWQMANKCIKRWQIRSHCCQMWFQ